jgi:hypothetical protein
VSVEFNPEHLVLGESAEVLDLISQRQRGRQRQSATSSRESEKEAEVAISYDIGFGPSPYNWMDKNDWLWERGERLGGQRCRCLAALCEV